MSEASRPRWPVVVGAIVTALSSAYATLWLQPQLLADVRPTLVEWGVKPAWLVTLVAALCVVGLGAVGWFVLARTVRCVQRAPFAWSAPVLLGISGILLAHMAVQSPIPGVPSWLFVLCAMSLMLVGGSLMQLPGWPAKVAGSFMLAMPMVCVAGADALTPQSTLEVWAGSRSQGRAFVLVLCGTWLSTIALALVARAPGAVDEVPPHLRDPLGGDGFMPAGTRTDFVLGASTFLLLATLGGAYSSVYLPMVRRVSSQQAMLVEAAGEQRAALARAQEQHERELVALRMRLDADRLHGRSQGSAAESSPVVAAAAARTGQLVPVKVDQAAMQAIDPPVSEARPLSKAAQRTAARAAEAERRRERLQRVRAARAERMRAAAAQRAKVRAARAGKATTAERASSRAHDATGTRGAGLAAAEAADDNPIGGLDSL